MVILCHDRVLVRVLLVVLFFFHDDPAVEVVDVDEVATAAACVELPRPERDPVVGVELVRLIFPEIRWQNRSVAAHLVPLLSALTRHRGTDMHCEKTLSL
jgi:hypothetical protein